jgi:hypothetical protein
MNYMAEHKMLLYPHKWWQESIEWLEKNSKPRGVSNLL